MAKAIDFSFIIPVYNRPKEIQELFESMCALKTEQPFEVVLVEDGSTVDAAEVVKAYRGKLAITYLVKANSGPGPSRNYGMERARGNYFIILDSDCLLPPEYMEAVESSLSEAYVDCFGGPDRAHQDFSMVQKAINYAMTSFLTTGGIRGGKAAGDSFEPRSFNMGLSKKAFLATGGFGNIHPGEDPDLSIRLKKMGFATKLVPGAYVYHKRRINFKAFYRQVRKFGRVRPILNAWHPQSRKITYWFPSLFVLGIAALGPMLVWAPYPSGMALAALYIVYLLLLFTDALLRTGSLKVAGMALWAVVLQFFAYGLGFLESTILVTFSRKKPQELFPDLFY